MSHQTITNDWNVAASTVKVGDYYRNLGRGYIARKVTKVEHGCNCEMTGAWTVDKDTRQPTCYNVVRIFSNDMVATYAPIAVVVLTDGPI